MELVRNICLIITKPLCFISPESLVKSMAYDLENNDGVVAKMGEIWSWDSGKIRSTWRKIVVLTSFF